jgi:TolB protein
MRSSHSIALVLGAALAVGVASSAVAEPASDGAQLVGRIAFSAGPLEPGRSNIYVHDLRTGHTTRVTHSDGIEFDPTLSPDGKRVAWRSMRHGNEEVRVADVDGTNVRNLTRHPAADYAPAWSSDAHRIAFASTRGSSVGSPHIWVTSVPARSSKVRETASASAARASRAGAGSTLASSPVTN